jgi:hypothetical protein
MKSKNAIAELLKLKPGPDMPTPGANPMGQVKKKRKVKQKKAKRK